MENIDLMLENAMDAYLSQVPNSRLKDALTYAVLGTGKHLRPKLMLTLIHAKGLRVEDYVEPALALEMVHTYSLIHDDLPAMDDDDLRRGQPTLHKAFDDATAILAGDALLSDAFGLITQCSHLTADLKVKMVRLLAEKIGSHGMVYGQILDIASEKKTVSADDLTQINRFKTAYLLEASILFGALIARVESLEIFEALGRNLGYVYQIQDDLLEVHGTEASLGKSFSDARREKPTFITLLGLEETEKLKAEFVLDITHQLSHVQLNDTPFASLIHNILIRTY